MLIELNLLTSTDRTTLYQINNVAIVRIILLLHPEIEVAHILIIINYFLLLFAE